MARHDRPDLTRRAGLGPVLVLVVVLGAGCARSTARPTASPSVPAHRSSVPTPPAAPTTSGIGTRPDLVRAAFTVVDPTRPTISHGRRISPSRTLVVVVVRPAVAVRLPLVIFAHGYNVRPATYVPLIDAIAAAGYLVAAPTFPLTNDGAGPDLDENDISSQPDDVRVVLAEVVRRSAGEDRLLGGGVLDTDRVGLVGHSDGAETMLATAYETAPDPRVKAVAALSASPLGQPLVGPTPLLVVQGDADPINPPRNAARLYAQASGPKALVTLLGATHLPPVVEDNRWRPVVGATVIDVLDLEVAGRTTSKARLITDATVPGVASIITAL